jgi:hypothetical protein
MKQFVVPSNNYYELENGSIICLDYIIAINPTDLENYTTYEIIFPNYKLTISDVVYDDIISIMTDYANSFHVQKTY